MQLPSWGERLREKRKAKGFTQVTLASAVGVDQTNISRIERGDGRPTDELKVRIAQVLGEHPHELFPLVDEPAEAGCA